MARQITGPVLGQNRPSAVAVELGYERPTSVPSSYWKVTLVISAAMTVIDACVASGWVSEDASL